jgi:hypothetical protein
MLLSVVIRHIVAYLLKVWTVKLAETAIAKGTAVQTRPLLGNSFLTRNLGVTGKRCPLRGRADSYAMKQ